MKLQDAIDYFHTTDPPPETVYSEEHLMVLDAARKYANIHPSRLHQWHILHIKPASWGLTHPLSCDLTDCVYQTQAESWDGPPDEIGNYQWEGDPLEDDWSQLDPPEDQ